MSFAGYACLLLCLQLKSELVDCVCVAQRSYAEDCDRDSDWTVSTAQRRRQQTQVRVSFTSQYNTFMLETGLIFIIIIIIIVGLVSTYKDNQQTLKC